MVRDWQFSQLETVEEYYAGSSSNTDICAFMLTSFCVIACYYILLNPCYAVLNLTGCP